MRAVASLAVTLLLLAGCGSPGGSGPGGGPGPGPGGEGFDGEAARAFVAGLVTGDDGAPRYRVPGTDGHAEAAAWLWDQMQVDGWDVRRQDFTGGDYEGLPKGAVGGYAQPSSLCTAEERERLDGLAFTNLWAVRRADPPSDRLVLLGAHWESKRFANQDDDPARRSDPVLGANDGASGVGLLLQLMRHAASPGFDLPFDLGVVFFDGEDGFEDCHPLAGSIYFVAQLGEGEVDRFLLLDMVGDEAARFVQEGYSCDDAWAGLLLDLAPGAGLADSFPGTSASVYDDHIPFVEAGIPALDLIDYGRGFPPYWHTTGDTMDNISAGMLGRVGDLLVASLGHGRFLDEWPSSCE